MNRGIDRNHKLSLNVRESCLTSTGRRKEHPGFLVTRGALDKESYYSQNEPSLFLAGPTSPFNGGYYISHLIYIYIYIIRTRPCIIPPHSSPLFLKLLLFFHTVIKTNRILTNSIVNHVPCRRQTERYEIKSTYYYIRESITTNIKAPKTLSYFFNLKKKKGQP